MQAANAYAETFVAEFEGELAKTAEQREPRAARKTRTRTEYDGLGRPVRTEEGLKTSTPDTYEFITAMTYDEAGNMLTLQAPGVPIAARATAAVRRAQPALRTGHAEHHGDGHDPPRLRRARTLRQYIDEKNTGRVVLSTFTHHDQIVRLVFEGAAEPLDTTSSHLLYSADRGDWVPTATLQAGDRLRTSTGEAKIASVERRNQARVFDIGVEGDHSCFALESTLLESSS